MIVYITCVPYLLYLLIFHKLISVFIKETDNCPSLLFVNDLSSVAYSGNVLVTSSQALCMLWVSVINVCNRTCCSSFFLLKRNRHVTLHCCQVYNITIRYLYTLQTDDHGRSSYYPSQYKAAEFFSRDDDFQDLFT